MYGMKEASFYSSAQKWHLARQDICRYGDRSLLRQWVSATSSSTCLKPPFSARQVICRYGDSWCKKTMVLFSLPARATCCGHDDMDLEKHRFCLTILVRAPCCGQGDICCFCSFFVSFIFFHVLITSLPAQMGQVRYKEHNKPFCHFFMAFPQLTRETSYQKCLITIKNLTLSNTYHIWMVKPTLQFSIEATSLARLGQY